LTKQPPPTNFTGTAPTTTLPAGTTFSRVHDTAYAGTSFNPVASQTLFGGGRFDSTGEDVYTYLYAADTDDAALAEALLRDIDPDDRGARFLAKRYWKDRELSRFRLTEPVEVITLRTGKELGAIGQDDWLTACGPDDYPQTRAWAHWLRAEVTTAQGIVWKSKRESADDALVLFGDRCPAALLAPAPGPLASGPCIFNTPAGFGWLRGALAGYRVGIRN
jgi:RES domain-containing protein